MTDTQHKYNRPTDTIFYRVVFLTLIGIYGFIIVREAHSLFVDFSVKRLIVLLLLSFVILGVEYLILQILLMRKEYDNIDNDKEIIIDNNNRQILIRQFAIDRVIKNEEIDSSEVYESWVAAYPLGYFKFIKITLKSGESFLITGFTLPLLESDLSILLKGTKMKIYRRFINRTNNCW
mgnify:CR=1 FL=1